jgi:hypothetical protein
MRPICDQPRRARLLFGLAGVMTLASIALALGASPWFLLLTVAVGVNELLFATIGECPASLLLRRACWGEAVPR